MHERRRHPRVQTHTPAKIIVDCFTVLDCVICDRSDSGARLAVHAVESVPNAFDLLADGAEGFRTCHVVWRAPDRLGVAFQWWWSEQSAA